MSDEELMKRMKERERVPEYQTEGLILDLNELICEAMENQGIDRAELARRLGTSRAYITRMLNGSPNFTIGSMVKVAMALDMFPEVKLVPFSQSSAVTGVPTHTPIEALPAPVANFPSVLNKGTKSAKTEKQKKSKAS